MVVAAFPLAKLLYLAVRQISKPIAQGIQTRAKASPFFRTYICMPPAQFYHWADVKIKMWVLNLGQPVKVAKLNEEQAIEQGAQILGELVIFSIAAGCMVADYVRSSRKESAKEAAHQARLFQMENDIQELGMVIEKQDAQIRELTRAAMAMKPKSIKIPEYTPSEIKLDFKKDLDRITMQPLPNVVDAKEKEARQSDAEKDTKRP